MQTSGLASIKLIRAKIASVPSGAPHASLRNVALLEAGAFDLSLNCKFLANGTKLKFWTAVLLQLQVCQSTVGKCPLLEGGEIG